MKTYSETQGKAPINWWDRIERLDTAQDEEIRVWIGDASSWITCACGNQCDIIPRKNGEPVDGYLMNLGMEFYLRIARKEKPIATTVLKQIEQRSTQLINEINNKP